MTDMTGKNEEALERLSDEAYRLATSLIAQMKLRAEFQDFVHAWMIACFSPETSYDKVEHNHHFLKGALKLVQANGYSRDDAHILVDYVFGQPVGDLDREIGGVMMKLAGLCHAAGTNMHRAGEDELARVWTEIDDIRRKHAAKPHGSPLPGPTPFDVDPAAAQAMIDQSTLPESASDLVSYSEGQCGAVMFHWLDEDSTIQDTRMIALGNGYSLRVVEFGDDPVVDRDEEDDTPELVRRWLDGEDVCALWNPTSPGEGYILASKHDTEDGPVAKFIRPLTAEDRVLFGAPRVSNIQRIANDMVTKAYIAQQNEGVGVGPQVLFDAAKALNELAAQVVNWGVPR
ncbi:MAG: hypothetical protein HQL41_05910 [Alphaproteobacteria bacterium]|nr:hypothetical protein [Alphaproteobacteria bacterium]